MKVLVTGAAGYLGRAVCAALRQRGGQVYATDIDKGIAQAFQGAPPPYPIHLLDVTAPKWDQDPPECVINLAGVSGVVACEADVRGAQEVNASGPVRLWQRFPLARFIQASTASILSTVDSRYRRTKVSAEGCLLEMAPFHGPEGPWPGLLIFRFGTVFGTRWGAFPVRWDLPVHRMVKDVLQKGAVELQGPECWRPWISLGTLADRVAKAAMEGVEWSGPVPMCSRNMTLGDVAATVVATLGRGEVRIVPQEQAGPSYTMPALCDDNCTLREEIKEIARLCEREFPSSSSPGIPAST